MKQKKEMPACGHRTNADLVKIKVDGKKVRVCIVCAHNHREGNPISIH